MRLNKSTDYAIQMLLYLAKAGKTVSSSKLAAAIDVSHRYLLQISAKLRAAEFIRAAHGPSGGLVLIKHPDKISLYDVIISMEGIVQVGKICGVSSSEIQLEFYALDMIYMRINTILECELKKISLKDILI